MTRKDFEKTAQIISYLTSENTGAFTESNMIARFVEWFMSENSRFDEYKFIKACGYKFGGKNESRYTKIRKNYHTPEEIDAMSDSEDDYY